MRVPARARDVRTGVSIQVPDDGRIWRLANLLSGRRLERPVAVPEQDADEVAVREAGDPVAVAARVGGRQIEVAIPVQVADRDRFRHAARGIRHRVLERPINAAKQDARVSRSVIRGREVRLAILVEVARADGMRLRSPPRT